MTTIDISIFNSAGELLVKQPAKSTARRFSILARAWQRQLDAMAHETPDASHATIGESKFTFDNTRRSQHQF